MIKVTLDNVKVILRNADVQGLIRMGAPLNEYDGEARTLYEALEAGKELTDELVESIFKESFEEVHFEGSKFKFGENPYSKIVFELTHHPEGGFYVTDWTKCGAQFGDFYIEIYGTAESKRYSYMIFLNKFRYSKDKDGNQIYLKKGKLASDNFKDAMQEVCRRFEDTLTFNKRMFDATMHDEKQKEKP